jgi:hypothetical protein
MTVLNKRKLFSPNQKKLKISTNKDLRKPQQQMLQRIIISKQNFFNYVSDSKTKDCNITLKKARTSDSKQKDFIIMNNKSKYYDKNLEDSQS